MTGVHFTFAGFAGVRRLADAHEVIDQVDAGTPVFAGAQLAVVDVDLAVLAFEAFGALARVRVEMGSAFSAVLARVGLAEVALLFTSAAFKSGLAFADEFVEPVFAGAAVQTRARCTLIDVGSTSRAVVTSGTVALESGDDVDAAAAVDTGRGQTFVNFGFTIPAGVAGMAAALVPVDAVSAVAVDAGIGEALVDVELAVLALSSGRTFALISGRKFFTLASVLTRPTSASIYCPVAKITGPSGLTIALEGVDVVDALAVLARIVFAVVDVDLAPPAGKSGQAIAEEGGERVSAGTSVETRIFSSAIVFVLLAVLSGESDGAGAAVAVDQVGADAAVDAGARAAFVQVSFTISSGVT